MESADASDTKETSCGNTNPCALIFGAVSFPNRQHLDALMYSIGQDVAQNHGHAIRFLATSNAMDLLDSMPCEFPVHTIISLSEQPKCDHKLP
jgi:hypothetical protein